MKTLFAKLAAFVGDISPKVKAGLNWGILSTLAIALLNTITPDMLSWSGPFEPVLFSAIPILVGQIAAWSKSDPLRDAGKAATNPTTPTEASK
jgi:hypothetical protein